LAPKSGRNGYRHTGSVTLFDNSLNLAPPRDSFHRLFEYEFGFAEFARQFLRWQNKSKNARACGA